MVLPPKTPAPHLHQPHTHANQRRAPVSGASSAPPFPRPPPPTHTLPLDAPGAANGAAGGLLPTLKLNMRKVSVEYSGRVSSTVLYGMLSAVL